jgi:hypothetical protein
MNRNRRRDRLWAAALVGSIPALGSWNTAQAKKLSPVN